MELENHSYAICPPVSYFEIGLQYADDVTWASNNIHPIAAVERKATEVLRERNLTVNISKTEKHHIRRNGNTSWKKCKYLGSLLDTEQDITRRKVLSMASFNKFKDVFNSDSISHETKLKTFRAFIASVFLYNSELWTVTKSLEGNIDAFHRRLLRSILGIKWPKKITNKELYKKTKETAWSIAITRRRIRWTGHLLRLPAETPAKQALTEAIRKYKLPRGGQRATWLKKVNKDLTATGFNITDQHTWYMASDRGSGGHLQSARCQMYLTQALR